MPEVMVPVSPSGEPAATTGWPTTSLAEFPSAIGVSATAAVCTLITARSVPGSRHTMAAGTCEAPRAKSTVMAPPEAAASITSLLVRMLPWRSSADPEPIPEPEEPRTLMVTRDGSTRAATLVTSHGNPLGTALRGATQPRAHRALRRTGRGEGGRRRGQRERGGGAGA